ncbi:MAG: folate-binding protein [Candidatus Dactylopiibacterium sp.]|nr:folate-binding protein [Candidatus Dactylopiibacterium sp.]
MNTDWTRFLGERGARVDAAGVSFATAAEETTLAAQDTVIVPLLHLGLIHATGADAAGFLHNLGSNDVKNLSPARAQHNSLSTPKGRMIASFVVWRDEAGYLLALSADLQAAITKKLAMYVLRAKVTLHDATQARVLIGLAGGRAAALLTAAGLTAPAEALDVTPGDARVIRLDGERYILDVAAGAAEALWQTLATAGARPAGSAAWRWLDIQAGLPLVDAQTQDEFIAQMLNFELLGGVNFKKGCYPGQEIVARTQYLGKLKKRMFRLHAASDTAPASGTDLYAPAFGEQSCGKVVSAQPAPTGGFDLLAVAQIAAFEGGELHLAAPDGARLTLATLPYVVD